MQFVDWVPLELMNEDWPEVLYEESEWPDDVPATTLSERTQVTDDTVQIIALLLNEGREIGW